MKRVVLFGSLLLIPLGLLLAAWQTYGYYQLQQEIQGMEREQQALVDDNRRLVAEYAFATSPGTIEKRASQELHMTWPNQNQMIALKLKDGGGKP